MSNGIRGYDLYKILKEYRSNEVGPTGYKRLIVKHSDINAKDNIERTALHYAAYFNDADMVELLLKAEAKTNIKDNNGKKPLSFAQSKEIIDLLRGPPARCFSKVMVSCFLAFLPAFCEGWSLLYNQYKEPYKIAFTAAMRKLLILYIVIA
ncbi:ankyrin repeat domain-containing protein [Wolbachia endosymbiont of Mansonella ozzardi]|uniref:ankyrin repeat domain-containing protein n=1 Tax=Wolbachia endosymbiont of Mansonella ozzardi TaxID=137464 RepID=UPI001CE09D10|nr:ankyrin repeat domain-containing protein [Wolbachia endosymbiont of Mansonella ozzardi]MCA4775311.1 ankyrin repeat domain-containing protein [Wolbachia endosymbiont of Mansonella ozzardi]